MTSNIHTIIIGGGLTGLVTAYYLKKAGINFRIIEKNAVTGGVIQTRKEQGFTYESGPTTGVLSHPEAAELFDELAGSVELEPARPEAKRRLIWKAGQWHALPSGPLQGITTPLFTFKDKLRLLGEPFRAKGTNPDETLADMVRRRLGASFLDYAIDPFISGIYAGDPERLIPRHALPKLYNLEQTYGSFIGGAIKKAKAPKSNRDKKATREVFSTRGGLGKLITALTDAVGQENILLNCQGTTIRPHDHNFKIAFNQDNQPVKLTAKHIVTTSGAYTLKELLPFLPEEDISPVTNLRYAGVVQCAVGFSKWTGAPLNAFGGLVPTCENRKSLGILYPSAFLTGRAPEKAALLSMFLGGTRNPEVVKAPEEQLHRIIHQEVTEMMNLKSFNPDLIRIFRYRYAIPQYESNTDERLKAIDAIEEKYPGLIIGGNLKDGIGMADRIRQAVALSGRIMGIHS